MKKITKLSLITKIIFAVLLFCLQLFPSSNKTDKIEVKSTSFSQQYIESFKQGDAFRFQGDYEKAIEFFNKSLQFASRAAEQKNRINSLIKLGLVYWNVGDLKKSDEFYNEALSLAKNSNLKEIENEVLIFIEIYELYKEGKNYRSDCKFQESIKSFNKAIDLARQIKSKEHEVKCLRQLSITYWESNDLHNFYFLNKQALEIARNINHGQEEGRCLNNIGIYWKKNENYSQALNHYEEALKIAHETKNLKDQSTCLTNIGNINDYIGNSERALEYMLEALKIDQQLEDVSNISLDLNNIGDIYRNKGLISKNRNDFYKALDYFNNCLELAKKADEKKIETYALNNLGIVCSDLENYPEALKYFKLGLKKAEEIQNKESTGMILNNIGIVYYNQGYYESSIEYLQKSIDLALQIKGGQILWEAYFEIANAYKKQKIYEDALNNYKNSISIIEDIRSNIKLEELKASYLGTNKKIEAYHNMIDLLVQLHQSNPEKGYNIEAFNYMERAKARAFLDSLEVSEVDISQEVNLELLDQEKEVMKEVSKIYRKLLAPELAEEQKNRLYEQLKIYEDSLESIKRKIRTTSPAYADLKYPQIISLEEAQKKLADSETAFFEYCLGKEKSYAFVITRKELKIFPLPPSQKIQEMVKDYLQTISDKDNQDFHISYELFSYLMLPGLNKKITKIIIAPDDILHFLPFETLIRSKDSKDWLIHDYKIAYIPSLSVLKEIIRHKRTIRLKPHNDLLAFGDPFFGAYEASGNGNDFFQKYYSSSAFNFFRLKYSRLEVDRISSLFKKTKKAVFTRKEASEDRIKNLNLKDYKILHFATHGLIDDKKPARSSIVLSFNQNSEEDGFLQMREIFNLKLNCDLVTLSACQTGLGQFIRGEGIESLSRAFFYAGASSALISLWAVNDQASAQLMERFYTYIHSSHSIMNALRKAKLEMIESDTLSHPYYWAGFIATGMADTVIFSSPLKKIAIIASILLLCGGITVYKGFFRRP